MQHFNRKQLVNTIKNFLIVILGTAILAFGTAVFIVPFDLITGGVSGIAIILKNLIPLDISIDLSSTAVKPLALAMGI